LLNRLQMKGGKKEMRKILLLIVMVTMFSVGVLYTSNSVEALTVVGGNTSINGSVEEQISLEILPNLLDFGQITPGIAKAGNNITFNATGSNENITIITSVDNSTIFKYIEFKNDSGSWNFIGGFEFDMDCMLDSSPPVCGYDFVNFETRITAPVGTLPGPRSGVITYTITGNSPA